MVKNIGKIAVFLFLSSLMFLVSGCDNHGSTNRTPNVKDLQSSIEQLNSNISGLKNQIISMQKEQMQTDLEVYSLSSNSASFSPSDVGVGYNVLNTTVGHLVVTLQKLYKYADGYRVVFSIGNPTNAIINNCEATVQWGKMLGGDETVSAWERSLQSKHIKLSKTIYPGTWTQVSFVLSPAQASQTAYISLSLKVTGISLFKGHR